MWGRENGHSWGMRGQEGGQWACPQLSAAPHFLSSQGTSQDIAKDETALGQASLVWLCCHQQHGPGRPQDTLGLSLLCELGGQGSRVARPVSCPIPASSKGPPNTAFVQILLPQVQPPSPSASFILGLPNHLSQTPWKLNPQRAQAMKSTARARPSSNTNWPSQGKLLHVSVQQNVPSLWVTLKAE